MASTHDMFDELQSVTDFTVTEEHLKLLRRAQVDWNDCEFGAPAIDGKRPYGQYSYVIADMAEILGIPDEQWSDSEGEPLPDAEEAFMKLHAETGIVLQIALTTGEFRAGRYLREGYGHWRRAGA